MDWLHHFSIREQIAFILAVFLAWCIVSVAWYVCGVNNLCAAAQAAEEIRADDVFVEITLADSQLPVGAIYDRSGAAADILIMLLVAFVLGALLGRILSTRTEASIPPLFSLPNGTAKEAFPERISEPVHISEFLKKVPANPNKPTVTIMHAAPKPARAPEPKAPVYKPSYEQKPAPMQPMKKEAAPIALGPAKSAPVITPKPAAPVAPKPEPEQKKPDQPERPKIRFNTSWNNPIRNEQAKK